MKTYIQYVEESDMSPIEKQFAILANTKNRRSSNRFNRPVTSGISMRTTSPVGTFIR